MASTPAHAHRRGRRLPRWPCLLTHAIAAGFLQASERFRQIAHRFCCERYARPGCLTFSAHAFQEYAHENLRLGVSPATRAYRSC
ncbi:hypothetical protein XFF6970_490225 [Xanthomonas citri pv. fuscans]|nr:hypothetical protein XFF6970_490225 [Xanthomonas citri pv. fuscans]